MDDTATKKDLAQLETNIEKKIDSAFEDITSLLQTFMHQVDARFNKVEQDIADLQASHDRLLNIPLKPFFQFSNRALPSQKLSA